MYPTPKYSKDILFISFFGNNEDKWSIEIIDQNGKVVFQQCFFSDSNYPLKLKDDSYIVRLVHKNKVIYKPLFTEASKIS